MALAVLDQENSGGNKNDDMAEYLACSDLLLSDISSCLYDFFITKRPTFSFFPDLEYYKNEERGLYIPLTEFPFQFSKNFEELLMNIETFDMPKYLSDIDKFLKKYGVD